MKHNHHVYAWGDPLCLETTEARKALVDEMLAWAKAKHYKLHWCCVTQPFADVLGGEDFNWSTLSCIQEDVLRES